jgi:hypothetical protein
VRNGSGFEKSLRDCAFHKKPIGLSVKKERETEPGWYKPGGVIVK